MHHDHHDNLYILLKGRKHFDLYSPAEALNMYTRGIIAKVHFNGKINFQEAGPNVRADGVDESIERVLRANLEHTKAEQEVAQAEADLNEVLH